MAVIEYMRSEDTVSEVSNTLASRKRLSSEAASIKGYLGIMRAELLGKRLVH